LTRNVVAEKYRLIKFFTVNIKLQNKIIHESVKCQYMVVDGHSLTPQITCPIPQAKRFSVTRLEAKT